MGEAVQELSHAGGSVPDKDTALVAFWECARPGAGHSWHIYPEFAPFLRPIPAPEEV